MSTTDSRQRWSTPWWLIHWVRERTLKPIALDACAELETRKADLWFGPGSPFSEDGLVAEWPAEGTIWVNPPYQRIGPWVQRAISHAGLHWQARVLLLVPPRTEQAWWHELVQSPQARCCYLRPRVEFDAPEGVEASVPSFPVVLWEVTRRPFALPTTHEWR